MNKALLKRTLLITCLILAALVVGITLGYLQSPPIKQGNPQPSLIQTNFRLLNGQNKVVTNQDFKGRWQLIFFGFTHCPDVCPTALDKMALVIENLGRLGQQIQFIFITLDPERDTPAIVAEYAQGFHPNIMGLSGSTQDIKEAASAFRVYYTKTEQADLPDGYGINHSGYLYLINPDGDFDRVYRWNESVAEIVSSLRQFLR
ncbi:MAG TPA: SCO family protein [Alphaproteobacteria bacterium]|nr:SCO family protein [Alphaproteobacteria bacterium]